MAETTQKMAEATDLPGVEIQHKRMQPAINPFAGRIGTNQELALDPSEPDNAEALKKTPDAGTHMSLSQSFNLYGFRDPDLWKAAVTEGFGKNQHLLTWTLLSYLTNDKATLLIVYLTVWIGLHPPGPVQPSQTPAGVYATSPFLGPLVAGICNWIILTIFIYSFGPISGGHMNPTITIATFCARLTSFPRMIMYLICQLAGSTLAGLLVRASYGSRNFAVGGCTIDTSLVPTREAFTMEFMATLILIFLSFGVALDPRQAGVFGPALAPCLVGLVLGVVSLGMSFSKPGVGVSLNPARCFGAFVGSGFQAYHWIHWVGPVAASCTHGVVYYLVPPWTKGTPLRVTSLGGRFVGHR